MTFIFFFFVSKRFIDRGHDAEFEGDSVEDFVAKRRHFYGSTRSVDE